MTEHEDTRTVRSIATMLGWGNVPPRETLERDIAALKARAHSSPVGAEPSSPGFNPDWDMLEATRASLREHMAMLKGYNALVALVQEWQAAMRETFPDGFEDVAWTDQRIELAERSLFAWTPAQAEPAAPMSEPRPTPAPLENR